jgi:hypothetical protein
MTIPFLALLILGAWLLGWHSRDRAPLPPDFDGTMARRWARKLWKRRRKS